jgi:hypothetical protein
MEDVLSRIINPESVGKKRNVLSRGVALATRELTLKSEMDAESKDLISFIGLSLLRLHDTVDETVQPWEKRGYWLKADRFRLEWQWTKVIGDMLVNQILNEDWEGISEDLVTVSQHLSKVKISPNHRLGTPWRGAYKQLLNKKLQQ